MIDSFLVNKQQTYFLYFILKSYIFRCQLLYILYIFRISEKFWHQRNNVYQGIADYS